MREGDLVNFSCEVTCTSRLRQEGNAKNCVQLSRLNKYSRMIGDEAT